MMKMIRSLIRDIIALYTGYILLLYGLYGQKIPQDIAALLGLVLIFFTIWFLLEKIGILPKLTP